MVAEDNKLNIMVIKQYLKKWNTQFSIVMNGPEALDLVKREQFDLILMEFQMPIIDGYTATREIRKLRLPSQDIPILALTALRSIKVN